jgi:hypothetical protein
LSPAFTKGGTWIVTPFSSTAGLLDFAAVWPFMVASAERTLISTIFGRVTLIGIPSSRSIQQRMFSASHGRASPTTSFAMWICS